MLGGVLWGLVYSAGYMVYAVALLSVFGACAIYGKFAKLNIWGALWIMLWAVLFNEAATMFSINLEIVNNLMPELSFARGLEVLFGLIQNDPTVKDAVVSDTIFNVVVVVVATLVMYIDTVVKSKKQARVEVTPATQEVYVSKPTRSTLQDNGFGRYYSNVKADFMKAVLIYKDNKDKDQFKANVRTLADKYLTKSSIDVKRTLKDRVENDLLQEGLSKEEYVTLTTILKML